MKKAIAIGINYRGTGSDLYGCETDAAFYAQTLGAVGYEVQLFNRIGAQTLYSMLEDLAGEKDLTNFVLAYSGHGTHYPDNTERDRMGEGMVFWDGRKFSILPDKFFKLAIGRFQCPVTVILDCCFSGGLYRAVSKPGTVSRFVQYSALGNPSILSAPVEKRAVRKPQPRTWLMASVENEPSLEINEENGGLFTNALQSAIVAHGLNARKAFGAAKKMCLPDQHPRMILTPAKSDPNIF